MLAIVTCAAWMLADAGCNSGQGPRSGAHEMTLYEAAAAGRSRTIVERMLDQGADINQRNPDNGWTALHAAAAGGHDKMVTLLLERGAAVNAQADDGSTPLHLAIAGHHEKVAAALMVYGADRTIRNSRGETADDRR